LPLAIGFALGTACPVPGVLAPLAVAALPLAMLPGAAPAALAAAGAIAATVMAAPTSAPTPTEEGTEEVELEGRVASVPERMEGRARFLLRDRGGRLLQASAPQPAWPIAWGDAVRLRARVYAPEGARNPGGRDLRALLAARGIAAAAHARTPPLRIAPPAPLTRLEAGRGRLERAAAATLPPGEAGLVRAIGAGDRSGIDPALNDAFARSGLAHLLSVSGLHLAVVALGCWRLLRALLLRTDLAAHLEPRRAAALLALPVAALYAVATGADVPVVRSALAAGLAFLGMLLDREAGALPSLSLALLAVLAAEPGALYDVSLQLSFASVAGLALLTGPLRAALPWEPGPGRLGRAAESCLSALAAGLAAALATAPLVAFHFRRVSLLAPLANLLGVPVGAALTVAAAAAALAAAALPALTVPLLWPCWPLAWLLLRINALFATPAAVAGVGSPGLLGVLASYAGLAGCFALRGWRRGGCAALALAGLAVPGLARESAAGGRGLLEVTFLSVGQGDAALLRLPDGSAALVDAGGDPRGRFDPGARDVLPFLRDAGVRRLWRAVLSHPHPDHGMGFGAVGAALPVERFLTAGRPVDDALAPALASLPPPVALRQGQALERAGVRLEALGPPPGAEAWSENDASLVLRVTFGETAFLLPGDVEGEGEEALLRQAPRLAADVVKVPHHGSPTSSGEGLVRASHPRFAVISLGRHNPFGFPSPAVVARWREAGAEVRRTDQAGAVRFLSDGREVWRAPAAGAGDTGALWAERASGRAAGRPGPMSMFRCRRTARARSPSRRKRAPSAR
jgi:competence protein ComEC